MFKRKNRLAVRAAAIVAIGLAGVAAHGQSPDPASRQDDLAPIGAADWNYDLAAHLLERAGFGGTPAEIEALARLTPVEAVARLVHFNATDTSGLASFEHSGIHDPGLEPFPPSRPAVTELAKETGEALGIKVKPGGNRRLQPVVNKFFYWLRASLLETQRVAYWWANRMVGSPRPLEEKNGAVLARSLCRGREQGARLPQAAGPA